MFVSAGYAACSNACRQNGNSGEATLAECPEGQTDGIHAPSHPDKDPQCMQRQPAQMELNMNPKEKNSLTTQILGKMKPM